MVPNLVGLIRLAMETVQNPKEHLRVVLNFGLTREHAIMAGVVIVILGVLIPMTLEVFLPPLEDPGPLMEIGPFANFLFQFTMLFGIAVAFFGVGRAFGGHATFDESLIAMVWLQFIMLLLTILQVLAIIFLPLLGAFILLASFFLLFYLLVNFAMEAHGFKSSGLVLAGVFATAFGLALLLSIVLSIIGIDLVSMMQ